MIEIKENEFTKLSQYIRRNYGINLSPQKVTLVTGRLTGLLMSKGFKDFSQYYEYLIKDISGNAVIELLDRITTNHTFFMREEKHFKFLNQIILPSYRNSMNSHKDIRIWSAGCSTGEEPYTIAMVIENYFGKEKPYWDTRILATDISMKVLKKAEQGIFSENSLKLLPVGWKNNYFKKHDETHYAISDKIKKEVIFRRFNLMDEIYPFKKKFHVIFCRNVMIYFNQETRRELIRKFYDIIEHGGYLFIGHSESLFQERFGFKPVAPSIYRKD